MAGNGTSHAIRNETDEENVCLRTYTNMTAWERDNIITFYGFTSALSNFRSSLSWIPCSREKCDPGDVFLVPHCCHGYTKDWHDGSGCPIEIERKNILDTLIDIQATSFLRTIHESGSNGLRKMLTNGDHPLTVFYLDNGGMEFTQNYSSRTLNSPRRFVKSHITKGLRFTETFKDEEVMTSLAGGRIRIRHILDGGKPRILANCVLVTDIIDHVTLNGVLHQVKKPIIIPNEDLLSWLKRREDLTILSNALQQSGVLVDASKATSFTIFAPTNAAFEKLPQQTMKAIFASPARLSALLKQYISDFSICDVMLDSHSSPCTLVGNRLAINRTEDGLFVNGGTVLESDIITTDGVVHVIDTAFIPEQALLIPEIFPDSSLVLSVAEDAGILSTLTNQHNLTFFAPDTNALQIILNDTRATEADWLTKVLKGHIIYAPYMSHDFTRADGTPLSRFEVPEPTDDENMEQLRRTVGLMKLQCARLVRSDIEAFNGHIHEIDKVLVIPTESAWDVLNQHPRFSIFVKFARRVGLESLLQTDNITVFVPENTIFHHFLPEDFNRLVTDESHLEDFIRYHIAKGRMCMSDVKHLGYPPPWYWFLTGHVETYLEDRHLRVVSGRDATTINNVDIAETDIVSLNGVIHVINGILIPPSIPPRLGEELVEIVGLGK
ncbi:putative transforming growth factor-beta-induced protein ig-h3-like [Apostichopus japonicus]|uniref:Putative transforming growth factor-beta-induced protein ig-h3-like n=1 Tax=Stichopus japonicus TaxID=307972 RepID=A0A2G8LPY9_STIJA|nr:putative transforming growth factor-beta-induced protein ig-h3-like [Apostichopus japonicus]